MNDWKVYWLSALSLIKIEYITFNDPNSSSPRHAETCSYLPFELEVFKMQVSPKTSLPIRLQRL